MEQLTLEQAAKSYIDGYVNSGPPVHDSYFDALDKSFKAGAEWQKEQYKLLRKLAFEAANICDSEGAVELCDKIKNELELLQD